MKKWTLILPLALLALAACGTAPETLPPPTVVPTDIPTSQPTTGPPAGSQSESVVTAECAGQQDPALFWAVHKALFENQGELWGAGRDYFVETAVTLGADQATFETCYDSQSAMDQVLELDNIRRQRGIFSQPQFDINGVIFVGAQPYTTFAEAIDFNLE